MPESNSYSSSFWFINEDRMHLNTVLSSGSKAGPNGGCGGLHQARRGYEDQLWTRTVRNVLSGIVFGGMPIRRPQSPWASLVLQALDSSSDRHEFQSSSFRA
jgi:hypothetical protein